MTQNVYMGVVEDRDDPLLIGRCRVRVIGVHSPDKDEIPTSGLPWATPIQPITSAAMNGIGHSPVGPVEGTWVVIMFTDVDMQHPIMIGTVGGIPTKENIYDDYQQLYPLGVNEEGELTNSSGNVVLSQNAPEPEVIQTGSDPTPALGEGQEQQSGQVVSLTQGEIGTLPSNVLDAVLAKMKERESTNNYKAVNRIGYIGGYQFGLAAMEDLGYVRAGSFARLGNQRFWKEEEQTGVVKQRIWTGKDGINELKDFLNNPGVQDQAVRRFWKMLFNRMRSGGMVSNNTPPEKLAGLLCVCHLKGHGKGGVRDFLKNQATPDGFGTSPNEYYNIGYKTAAGLLGIDTPVAYAHSTQQQQNTNIRELPIRSIEGVEGTAISNSSLRKGDPTKLGFIDPKLRYPLDHMINEPDTNRLSRHQQIEKTLVFEKQSTKVRAVSFANSSTTWSQPNVPYNAKYPYNHVYNSESGHVLEFDDTPGSERIHLYHKSGTFSETDTSGNQVNKIVGSQVNIIEKDGMTYISGTGALTVDGDLSIDVKRSLNVTVRGDVQLRVEGNVHTEVDGDMHTRCKSWFLETKDGVDIKVINTETQKGDIKLTAGGTEGKIQLHSVSNTNITSSSGLINLNSKLSILLNTPDRIGLKAAEVVSSPVRAPTFTGNLIGTADFAVIAGSLGGGGSGVKDVDIPEASKALLASSADIVYPWTPELYPINNFTFIDSLAIRSEGESESGSVSSSILDSFDPPSQSEYEGPKFEPNVVTPSEQDWDFVIETPITAATRLSPNFTVGDFGVPQAQLGLSERDIVLNMQTLCKQLEKIKEAIPGTFVYSGFRKMTESKTGSKKVSQHCKGQAADLHFKDIPYGTTGRARYTRDVAEWISNNIEFDQLLLEFRANNNSCWVHISYVQGNNRNMVLTLNNDETYAQGLVIPGQPGVTTETSSLSFSGSGNGSASISAPAGGSQVSMSGSATGSATISL